MRDAMTRCAVHRFGPDTGGRTLSLDELDDYLGLEDCGSTGGIP